MTQSNKGLTAIAEDASPRRYVEISLVKVKDTHLIDDKLPPAEILPLKYKHGYLTSQ